MKRIKGKKGRVVTQTLDPKARTEVQELLGENAPRERQYLIEYLHRIQDRYGHISRLHMQALCAEMNLSLAEGFETATFYHHFDVQLHDDTPPPPPHTIRVCDSISCAMMGAESLIRELRELKLPDVRILPTPCVGRCAQAPVAVFGQRPIVHADRDTVCQTLKAGLKDCPVPEAIPYADYRKQGGYQLLRDCLDGKHPVDTVIGTLEDSGLRGLGGAGFPAGRKWKILRAQRKPRLVAINIDEGEPGTFKDRHFLETDPHRFIEGTLIATWAIEAEAVYLYLRDEYAGCRQLLEQELQALLADPPCDLPPIHLRRGAGAYICGEESAMIESIEGKKGLPRLRPPFVAEVGLFGHPTLEHNMETMHWVRDILEHGKDWFCSNGRRGRTGLRSFSVSGRVNRPGVHLAPAGISVRELIDEYCDGMQQGHTFYGYFPGGASGGILPAELGDEPLDFDTLQPHGCFIGSAAIIVLSQQDSARTMALNAMRFFEHESCGQCTPCRVGTGKAAALMEQPHWDPALLEELASCMEDASICGLGQAAPNPLRCAMRYFPGEFD